MKKSLNKVIVTLAAVTALAAAMSVTAFADVTANEPTDGKTQTTYEKTGATPGEQVTLLVLKPDVDTTKGISESDIAYIDQKAADENGKATFDIKLTGVTDTSKEYSILSSTASATVAPTKENLTFTGSAAAIHYGDVDLNNDITNADALQIMKYLAFFGSVFDDETSADYATIVLNADVTKDGQITNEDALQIMYYGAIMDEKVTFDHSWLN